MRIKSHNVPKCFAWSWCVVGTPHTFIEICSSYISVKLIKTLSAWEVPIILAFNQCDGNFISGYCQVIAVCKTVKKLESLTEN